MLQALRVAQFLAYGYTNFGVRGYKAHAKSFSPTALNVDLTGRHVIVTGATSGLGRVTATALASKKATVHLVCRSSERGNKVRDAIVTECTTADVRVHQCDLSSLTDIARLADHFNTEGIAVRALVNNAGMMNHDVELSADGFESNFATNTLGTFALTEMLRPALARQPGARVINVSSGGMLTENLETVDLEGHTLRNADGKTMDGAAQYARCKRRQVAMTEYWGRKYGSGDTGTGILWASMHPGWAGTPGLEKSMPDFYNATKNQLRSEEQGADTIVYLTVAEEVSRFKSGDFFFDRRVTPKHLWFGGTQYKQSEVDGMMTHLRQLVTDKGFKLPA